VRKLLIGCLVLPVLLVLVAVGGVLGARTLLNARNERRLAQMGDNRARFEELFARIEDRSGCWVLITSGNRTEAEQAALKKKNSKNASPGRSLHERQRAMDLNSSAPRRACS